MVVDVVIPALGSCEFEASLGCIIEFKATLHYMGRPCLKKKKKINKNRDVQKLASMVWQLGHWPESKPR